MASTLFTPFRNGQYSGSYVDPRKVVGPERGGPFGFLPATPHGIQDWIYFVDPCMILPVAADSTITVTNSGTITIVAGGLRLTTGAADTNNTTIQQIRSLAPAANKRFFFACRMQHTVVAKGKSAFGLMNTAAAPIATPPTDGAFFSKDTAGTGVIKGNLIGTSTAATAVTIHTAVLATDYEYGLVYTPTDANDGRVDFWYRAANAEGWGDPTASITAASGAGPAAALRRTLNLNATDGNALTADYQWIAHGWEL